MPESGDLNGDEPNKISRKGFLKLGVAGTVTLGTGIFLEKEYSKYKEGVITPVGTFIPLYERHDLGIKATEIPSDLDGFFREAINPRLMEFSPQFILEATGEGRDTIERSHTRAFPDQILQKLSQQETEIIVGDINLSKTNLNSSSEFFSIEANLGSLAIVASALTHLYEIEHKKDTRRDFLKKTLAGFAVWGLAPLVTNRLNPIGEAQEGVIKRIAARLYGISTDFHPEDLLTFLRNAMMADKLLTVAEQMKSQMDKNPKIAFQVEGGHSGIEDFLIAGSDICRFLVLSYPNNVLKPIVLEDNNGIKDFCSARLFKFSKDINLNNSLDNISERRIIDTKLQQDLEKKFQV